MFRLSAVLGLGILGVALLVGVAETQDAKKDSKGKGNLPPGWKNLNLSPEQKAKVYEVMSSYKSKINELSKQMKQLADQERAEMVKILTDDQRAQLVKPATGDSGEKKSADKK
jgi:Spy/CpxP family protein refolding chaperone